MHLLIVNFRNSIPCYDWLIIPVDIVQRRRKQFGESAHVNRSDSTIVLPRLSAASPFW